MTVLSLPARLWTYQAERFPLAAHLPLVLAFTAAATVIARPDTDGLGALLGTGALLPVAALLLAQFLLLRIADEFKDAGTDARTRPHRPVPRGLVSLRELGALGLVLATVQLGLVLATAPGLLGVLLLVWGWFALMSAEFFVPGWLRARPLAVLLFHMAIMPCLALLALAGLGGGLGAVVGAAGAAEVSGFCALAFAIGLVLELGRKLRAPSDERAGIETYTALWGQRRAILAWLLLVGLSAGLCLFLLPTDGSAWLTAAALAPVPAGCLAAGAHLRAPGQGSARRLEVLSGLSALWLLLSLIAAVI